MAVGKTEYREIIERNLVSQSSLVCLCLSNLGHQFCFHFFQRVPCLFDEIVMEVMWGLQNLMHFLVPKEKKKFRKEDRIPMSLGLKMILNRYGFDFSPEMVSSQVPLMLTLNVWWFMPPFPKISMQNIIKKFFTFFLLVMKECSFVPRLIRLLLCWDASCLIVNMLI